MTGCDLFRVDGVVHNVIRLYESTDEFFDSLAMFVFKILSGNDGPL
jgi:hypothetical protein